MPNLKDPPRRPTKYDVAERAGVSPTTVTFVMTGRNVKLAESTRERVRQAAAELGYQPNAMARALNAGRTGLVSFWIQTLRDPYHAGLAHHIEEQVSGAGRQLMVNVTRSRGSGEADDIISGFPTDGTIVNGGAVLVSAVRAANKSVPVVQIGSFDDDLPDIDSVTIDLATGVVEAVEHLVRIGRRRIAYVRTPMQYPDGARTPAYQSTLKKSGLTPEIFCISISPRTQISEEVASYIRANGCPDGLFCLNDEIAIAAYRAILSLGFRVPEDVAIVGCDGIPETENGAFPMSTVVQPVAEMCRIAWQLLERRMKEPDADIQNVVLPSHLAIRESSAPML